MLPEDITTREARTIKANLFDLGFAPEEIIEVARELIRLTENDEDDNQK